MGADQCGNGDCCPIAAKILVGYRQTMTLIEALHPFHKFEKLAAHLLIITAFESAALQMLGKAIAPLTVKQAIERGDVYCLICSILK